MNDEHPLRRQCLEMTGSFMPMCVLGAAAELDLFTSLGEEWLDAGGVAERLGADRRAVATLLDALAALEYLDKREERYRVPEALRPILTEGPDESVLPMIRHRMNMLRHWGQLAWTVKTGVPFPGQESIRGFEADRAAFIGAMHAASRDAADRVVAQLGPPRFEQLLDVGGASGTWTRAFLRTAPKARATVFDLPDAIEQARHRFAGSEMEGRVTLVAGDFYVNELPAGADFAWISAVIHQHSRRHTRALFAKVHRALRQGGTVAVRDIVMDPSRTRPVAGALFAVNMLVGTQTGGTFTFDEIAEDLLAAGFRNPRLALESEWMDSVVVAEKA